MKRNLTLLAATSAIALVPLGIATAKEPTQPASSDAIIAYHDSGEWDADTAAVTKQAKTSLIAQLKKKPKKPAIVFDIDDTLESSYDCQKASGSFGQVPSAVCVAQSNQTPIPQTKSLFKYAQKKKVAVDLITGRPEGLRQATIDELKRDGFTGKFKLYLRPNDDPNKDSVIPYKSGARKSIQKAGYKILVNIGDQQSDLKGGFSVKRFKVPNPMYFTP
jgi:predicted secreted acid phosphatase